MDEGLEKKKNIPVFFFLCSQTTGYSCQNEKKYDLFGLAIGNQHPRSSILNGKRTIADLKRSKENLHKVYDGVFPPQKFLSSWVTFSSNSITLL